MTQGSCYFTRFIFVKNIFKVFQTRIIKPCTLYKRMPWSSQLGREGQYWPPPTKEKVDRVVDRFDQEEANFYGDGRYHTPLAPALCDGRLSTYDESVLKLSKESFQGKCARMGHPPKLSSPTKLSRLGYIPPAGQAGRLAGPVFYTISFLWTLHYTGHAGPNRLTRDDQP
jgi:hypothetical protein